MPEFNDNDINEAKRRVWEMQNRASKILDDSESTNKNSENETKTNSIHNSTSNIQNNTNESDNSFLIILSLILILQHEGADNSLIFALLYLLL